jgi:RHS repeat-associated protein
LGSSTLECNEDGEVISLEEYYPYGASAYRASSSSADLSLKRYRFTGKERDEETGLDYFGVRYYASWLGRWTSGDPGGFVDGLNLYRYARNNPVNGIDAEGYSTEQVESTMLSEEEGSLLENEDSLQVVEVNNMITESSQKSTSLPPDDIYIGYDGKVVKIVENDQPDRLLITNADYSFIREIELNDPELDRVQLASADVGDQLVHILSGENQHFLLEKGKSTIFLKNIPIVSEVWGITSAATMSRGGTRDFGYSYLASHLSEKAMNSTDNSYFAPHPSDSYSLWDSSGGFIMFAGEIEPRAYNIPDAGNFLWGAAMHASNVTFGSTKLGSITDDSEDSTADQLALSRGYFHYSRISNPIGEFFWYSTEKPSFWQDSLEGSINDRRRRY